MPVGSWRSVLEIAAWTSWAAASMFRSRVNCSVMLVLPRFDEEVIWSTPAIVENCFSSGVATADAIVSGLAPGRLAFTVIVGKSTLQVAHGQQAVGHDPEQQDAHHDERRHHGPLDEELGEAHLSASSSRAGSAAPFTSTGAPGTSRSCPSVTTSSPGRTPTPPSAPCARTA